MKKAFAAVVAMVVATPTIAAEDKSVQNAYSLCSIIDGTGLASSACEVSGWNSSVTTTIDMTSGEARKLCSQVAGEMKNRGVRFRQGWTLQIKSPYSGTNSIAFCNL
ncbi:hypothetical protein EXN24_05155 [Rhizobium rhizogenes]|uniref:Uncharacterized protein n=1 Tax=Rhizobium rhizogenes TaxID=359 RepID=A0AA95AJE0_RHIRH|nr:hypothetical protein [Rhizobium rhizogenes]TRA90900.1 hypothetical protein EXN24_05155 [Rhizobium rhizogenes]